MNENIIAETEKEKYCKHSIPKVKVAVKMDKNHSKASSVLKIIVLIFFLIILISGLLIFAAYFYLSKKKSKGQENNSSIVNAQLSEESKIPSVIDYPILKKSNSYAKKVLFLTNYFSKKIPPGRTQASPDTLYKILLGIKTISMTIFDVYDPTLNNKDISFLKNFDLVVIDFYDGGYDLAARCKNFTINLIEYVKAGGALFTSHDQFDSTHSVYITQEALKMISLLGFIHQNSWGIGGSIAYFEKPAIDNSIFLVNHALYGDSINISYTHQTYSKYNTSCETCNVVMKFVENGSRETEYLVTNRPNNIGKTINIRAGHTFSFTEEEKKIFLSSILWLLYDI